MRIYDFKGFPNPARVRIALEEKGLTDQVEFVSVDVPGGEHKTAAFAAKNPAPRCGCWSSRTEPALRNAPPSPNISTICRASRH